MQHFHHVFFRCSLNYIILLHPLLLQQIYDTRLENQLHQLFILTQHISSFSSADFLKIQLILALHSSSQQEKLVLRSASCPGSNCPLVSPKHVFVTYKHSVILPTDVWLSTDLPTITVTFHTGNLATGDSTENR